MASLLDVLQKQRIEQTQPFKCVVGSWVDSLEKEEQDAFDACVTTPGLNAAKLYTTLTKEIDLPFKATVFRSHVKGYCSCQKN